MKKNEFNKNFSTNDKVKKFLFDGMRSELIERTEQIRNLDKISIDNKLYAVQMMLNVSKILDNWDELEPVIAEKINEIAKKKKIQASIEDSGNR